MTKRIVAYLLPYALAFLVYILNNTIIICQMTQITTIDQQLTSLPSNYVEGVEKS